MGSDGRIGRGLGRQVFTRQRVFSVDLPEAETPRGGRRERTGPSELRSGKRRFRAGALSPLRRSGNGCGLRGGAKVRIEFPASRGQKTVASVEHRTVACKSRCGEQNARAAARPKRHAQAEHAGWRASCERGSLGTIFIEGREPLKRVAPFAFPGRLPIFCNRWSFRDWPLPAHRQPTASKDPRMKMP
jgi:hypothetical protein